jgi:hypothetical protein
MHAAIPFNFELPIECWYKAGEAGKERRIGGVISTQGKDRQREVVLQRGLDFNDFLRAGWINDNHSKDTTGIVGYPTKVERISVNGKPATRFEGYLLQGYERADEIWKLANALQKTNRRLGFSIEGSVSRREGLEGEVVAQAKVRNVAVTNCPVNTDTRLEILAKSLSAIEQAAPDEDEIRRALSAGSGPAQPGVAVIGSGAPLMPESMERKPKIDIRRRRKLTKAEAEAYVMTRFPGMTAAGARRIVRYAASAAARRIP